MDNENPFCNINTPSKISKISNTLSVDWSVSVNAVDDFTDSSDKNMNSADICEEGYNPDVDPQSNLFSPSIPSRLPLMIFPSPVINEETDPTRTQVDENNINYYDKAFEEAFVKDKVFLVH